MNTQTADRPQVLQWTIGQIAVPVRDVERAITFYRDVLGMTFQFAAPPGLAFFECSGVRLMLSAQERPAFNHPSSIIYFSVDDVEASYRSLQARGVHFFDKPHVIHETERVRVLMAFFSDLDRNVFGIMQEVAKTAG